MAWDTTDVLDPVEQQSYDWRQAMLEEVGLPEPYRDIIARDLSLRAADCRLMILAGCDPVLAAKIVL